jgi:hypothetical protein
LVLEAKSLRCTQEGHQARVHSDQMVLVMFSQRLDQFPGGRSRAVFCQAKAKGDYQARVLSDQMVLMIVRQEAGTVAWWPKTLN